MFSILKAREFQRGFVRLSKIMDAVGQPIWQRDEKLNIIFCNNKYLQLAEVPENVREIAELDKEVKKLAQKALEIRQPQSRRLKIVSGGKRMEYDVCEQPFGGGTVGYAQHIDDLLQAEEEIKRYKDVQSQLLETSASAIAIYGPDQKLRFFNNAFVNLWKLDESWLGGEPTYGEILETLREKRRLPEQADFRQFKADNIGMFSSLTNTHEDFYFLPNERSLRVISFPHALGGIQIIYEDMTDRLALERSYNTLLAVQTETLANLDEGVAVFGESGKLTLSNPVYAKMWGLDEKYLQSEPFFYDILERTKHLYNYSSWIEYKKELLVSTLNREPINRKIELTSGKVLEMKNTPLPDGEILVTYNDITASILVERSLRERTEALEDVDRLKTEFLTNVSYELRSPLTSIIGFTEILMQEMFGELNKKQKIYLEDIHKSSKHLELLINDILDVSSIEAGYMKLSISSFDVHAMLSAVINLLHERMRDHSIDFEFTCRTDIGKMSGDEVRIRQVIFNIISNSIKFTQAGGEIRLGAVIENGNVLITVADNGYGIPQDKIKNVFKKFEKSKDKGGTGLGLSVAKNFVELHHGSVQLESEEGKGTKVTVILPVESKANTDAESILFPN